MRGDSKDTIWILVGVVLLFGVMATFSPGSTFGRAFISLRQNLENVFGGEVGYCPFINPYAMSIYSAGELVITSNHPLCGPVQEVLVRDENTAWSADPNGVCGSDIYSIKLDVEEANCGEESCVDVEIDCGTGCTSTTAVCDNDNDLAYDDTCTLDGDGSSSGLAYSFTQDEFFSRLSDLQQVGLDKDNNVAVQLLTEKRPAWQCFFIFGLLPFFITYYLINDILTFAYLRTNTRRLIAIFASLLAVLTGGFANIIVAIASFVGLSIGQTFLVAIFSLAMLSVFLGQITVTAGVAKTTVNAVQQAVTGALVLRNVAQATSQQEKQE